ncbi:MAG: hypothetical protein N3F07_03550 [Candidatus Micrarchaeota archaeon]|nr:hypothetical protein [Candidatus Micrarchaeota archaeon]
MAKDQFDSHRRERMAYGIFISALGCLWLAAEVGWVSTGVPIGPISVILIGIAFFLPWLKK